MASAISPQLIQLLDSSTALDPEQQRRLSDLYSLHWKGLCRYVRATFGVGPPEPEDVAQTAFARFAAARQSEIDNAQAFLYTTARHIVLDHHRHARRSKAHDVLLPQSQPENDVYELSPENVLLQMERFEILAQALEAMPAKHRRLVLLNRFEGLSYGDIGKRFGMSAENVRKHIERTVAECARALESAQRLRLKHRGRP